MLHGGAFAAISANAAGRLLLRMTPPVRLKLLFVCGKNQWRSPTGEALYRDDPRVEVRSAGVSPEARRRVTARDLAWADLVLTMERKHTERLRQQFPDLGEWPDIRCLGIPDDYPFMDPELMEMLRTSTEPLLDQMMF